MTKMGCLAVALMVSGTVSAQDFAALAAQCAPNIAVDTLRAIVKTESSFNPYAIGIVPKPELKEVNDGLMKRRPQTLQEALSLARDLQAHGYTFAVGLGQINTIHLPSMHLTLAEAFDPCNNLKASAQILSTCYQRAIERNSEKSVALKDALSCYYSGSFTVGYRHGYVDRVLTNAGIKSQQIEVPSLQDTLNAGSNSQTAKKQPQHEEEMVISRKQGKEKPHGLVF